MSLVVGRMATGIRVVHAGGRSMDFGTAMLREVAVKWLLFGVAGSLTGGIAQILDVLSPRRAWPRRWPRSSGRPRSR